MKDFSTTISLRVSPDLRDKVQRLAHLKSLRTGNHFTASTLARLALEKLIIDEDMQ